MIAATDPFSRPRVAIPDTVELRGPADADHFRVMVGRYGDRWYHDPLGADEIAPTSTEVYPSVSTVKKASGSDWTLVGLKRVATALDTDTYRKLAEWPYADRYEGLKAINKNGLNRAAQRGTNVHLMFEAHLYGQPCPIRESDPGYEYRPAVDQFFDHYQPTLIAAEVVCINRTLNNVGYGGTSDCFLGINGGTWNVDWKSRGIDSDHGAYPEEGAQVSAGAGADYLIVEGPDGPERRLLPELSGGLIVSIKPDGCRIYPIDLTDGFNHWTALHAWWCARRDERKAIGRQWAPRKNAPALDPGLEASAGLPIPAVPESVRESVPSAPDSGTPVATTLTLVDAKQALCMTPEQGADFTSETDLWERLKGLFDSLDPTAKSWRSELVSRAQQHNVGFMAQTCKTERSYWLNHAVIALALNEPDDDILRALMAAVVGDVAFFVGLHTGHILGSFNANEAQRLAGLVDEFNTTPPSAA